LLRRRLPLLLDRSSQQVIGKKQCLPQLPDLLRGQVETTVGAPRLSFDTASAGGAGPWIGEAHAHTVS
jgi:hypothetical protein